MDHKDAVFMVIGIGRIGKIHVENLRRMSKVKVKYIVDIFFDGVTQYIRESGLKDAIPLHLDEITKAYGDDEVNTALICTPTNSHEEHTINALTAGKHVMCEKPLAFSLKSIARCYDLAHEKGLHLYCAFNRRFDPTFRSAWLNRDKIAGKLKSIKITARDLPRNTIEYLRISGGMSIDQCIHDVDLIRWFAQQDPVTVYAVGHAFFDDIRDIGDVDQLYIIVTFPDGSMAHVDANREAIYGYDNRMEIFGDKGMIVCDIAKESSMLRFTEKGNFGPEINQNVIERFTDSYREEMKHFVDVIAGRKDNEIKSRDTLWATLICDASRESLATGQPIRMGDFAAKVFPKLLEL